MEVTPLEAIMGVFSVFQALLSFHILRHSRHRPTWLLSGLLFLLNGLIGIFVVLAALTVPPGIEEGHEYVAASHWRERIVPALDEPTNFLLILLGISLLVPKWDEEQRVPRRLVHALWIVAALSVLHAAYRFLVPPVEATQWMAYRFFVHDLPLHAGYSLLLLATAHCFHTTPPTDATSAYLLLGWGARPVHLALLSAPSAFRINPDAGIFAPAYTLVNLGLLLAALAAVAHATWTSLAPGHRRLWWAPFGLAIAGAFGLGLLVVEPRNPAAYNAAQLATLLIIRPLLVGYALQPHATTRLLARVLAWSTSLALVKLLFAASLHYAWLSLNAWDLAALPLGILLGLVADRGLQRIEATLSAWTSTRSKQAESSPRRTSNAARVLHVLLQGAQETPPRAFTTKEISQATGIAVENVSREIRSLRRRLVHYAPSGASEMDLLPRRRQPEGQALVNGLTSLGADAGQQLLAELESQPAAKAAAADPV